jgi:putative oxidoreductase
LSSVEDRIGHKLIIPPLAALYNPLGDVAEALMRVAVGVALLVHGFPKITNPFGLKPLLESIGFYPGEFWSTLVSGTEFFGGILLVVGLLTRPAAFASLIVILVTIWVHWVTRNQGYMGAEKMILWAAILFFVLMRGGNRFSVDARIGRQF